MEKVAQDLMYMSFHSVGNVTVILKVGVVEGYCDRLTETWSKFQKYLFGYFWFNICGVDKQLGFSGKVKRSFKNSTQ